MKPNPLNLSLHHVGCAVPTIASGLATYRDGLQLERVSRTVPIASQQVEVCFVETAPGVYVELVAPAGDHSPVNSFLKRRQHYYHLCYNTPNVPDAVALLGERGFRRLSVFDSEAFNGQPCAFLLTPDLALLELCTQGAFTLL